MKDKNIGIACRWRQWSRLCYIFLCHFCL